MDNFDKAREIIKQAPPGAWVDVKELVDEYEVNELMILRIEGDKYKIIIITPEYDRTDAEIPKDLDPEDSGYYRLWMELEQPVLGISDWWEDWQVTYEEIVSVEETYQKLMKILLKDQIIILNMEGEIDGK